MDLLSWEWHPKVRTLKGGWHVSDPKEQAPSTKDTFCFRGWQISSRSQDSLFRARPAKSPADVSDGGVPENTLAILEPPTTGKSYRRRSAV